MHLDHAAVDAVLDAFHAAAAVADEARYFEMLSPNVVFLGTAPRERWAGDDFRTFVHSHFSRGKGWAYTSSGRSIDIGGDGRTAWFDETVSNDSYGECRGTGVLRLHDGEWKIEQYNLTILIPDELAADVVARIRVDQ